jgi:hypothetical protein
MSDNDSPHVVAMYQVIRDSNEQNLNDPIVRRFLDQLKAMQPLQIKLSVKDFYANHLGIDPAGDSQTMERVQMTVEGLMEYRKMAISESK